MADGTEPPSDNDPPKKSERTGKLRAVKGEAGSTPRGHPKNPFARGNKLASKAARRKWHRAPANPVDEIDRIAKETLTRLRRREYVTELVGDEDAKGRRTTRRVEKPLEAPKANAIVMCLRLRLDVFAQYGAGEEIRRLQEEVGRLAAMLPRGTIGVPR
jgi:hypothetical protein